MFWFSTWRDTNQAVRSQKMARGLRFRQKRDCTIYVAKTKALISFAVTAKLIFVFVFAYAKPWFSHEAAHIIAISVSQKDGFSNELGQLNCLHNK